MNDKKRDKAIRVWVNPEEKRQIEATLENVASNSVSSFLRTLGLYHEPKSIIDQKAILALIKINADQNRLGGLLKMSLSNDQNIDHQVHNKTNILLDEIKEVQEKLLLAVNRL